MEEPQKHKSKGEKLQKQHRRALPGSQYILFRKVPSRTTKDTSKLWSLDKISCIDDNNTYKLLKSEEETQRLCVTFSDFSNYTFHTTQYRGCQCILHVCLQG